MFRQTEEDARSGYPNPVFASLGADREDSSEAKKHQRVRGETKNVHSNTRKIKAQLQGSSGSRDGGRSTRNF